MMPVDPETGGRALVCDVRALRADAAALEVLARLALVSRRLGRELRLRHATRELAELVAFAGLAGVLGLEPLGEAEEREERAGREEEGELGDAPAR
jgi:hypothetical protein